MTHTENRRIVSMECLGAPLASASAVGTPAALDNYRELRAQLLQFARHLAPPDVAEDLVQEAFLSVLRRGPSVPRDGFGLPQLAYLCTTVRNAMVDRIRRERVQQRRTAESLAGASVSTPAAEEGHELRDRLAGALPRLSRRQWQAATLTTLGGLTAEQAAESVGSSREAICGSRDRAMRELRLSIPGASGASSRGG